MVDTDLVLARLRLATDQAEALQAGLGRRQGDLLDLEKAVHLMADSRSSGRVVTDQAEDIRRAIGIHTTDQLADVQAALIQADLAIARAAIDGCMAPETARTLSHAVDVADEETRRTGMALHDVGQALARISGSLPGNPYLPDFAQEGIDQAAVRLENARRSVFRVVEDLPTITSGVEGIEQVESEAVELEAAGQSRVAPGSPAGSQMDPRQPGPMTHQQGDSWAR
ncbi:hypothetical protein GCM10022234_22400 [Aeromicrobium panaciterrae]